MRLVYAKLTPGNFGDELNPYLWPRLFPAAFDTSDDTDFLGIGTILSPYVARNGRRKIVFGAGAGYWKAPLLDSSWKVYFVRGPRTARMLGLESEKAITDGAYCLAFVDQPPAPPAGNIVFMPHHKSEDEVDWQGFCTELGWDYLSPAADVETGLTVLRAAKLIVTEAMHGAIIADLYRVPWVAIRYGFRSLDMKWQDWCESLSLTYRPVDLPPLLDAELGGKETAMRAGKRVLGMFGVGKPAWRATPVFRSGVRARNVALQRLRAIPGSARAATSSDVALERAKSRLWDAICRFKSEHAI